MRLADPLTLPCGLIVKNRIAKAAMTEQLARDGNPNAAHDRLYARFAAGGAGLVITGNLMVDRDQREHPRNVVIDDATDVSALRRFREAAGPAVIGQLSHPGRQAVYSRGGTWAPSAVPLQGLGPFFKTPRALDEARITDVIARFVRAACILDDAGFAGVQVHAAHGYLLSQFLSPRVNQRTDRWGGSLENRARLLLEIVAGVRAATRPGFAVAVKLNSADFQKGGFDDQDALAVMKMLEGQIDLLEISGGSYEAPAMVGMRASSIAREAYFGEFAARARTLTSRDVLPLMVTGGFRTPAAMEASVASSDIDVVGLARPLALDPDLPNKILAGNAEAAPTARDRIGLRFFDALLSSQIYVEQLHLLAAGKPVKPRISRLYTIAHAIWMSQVTGD